MVPKTLEKFEKLKQILEGYGHVAVAFSGGVDSTFLAKVAFDVLRTNSVVITVDSEAYPPDTIEDCIKLAQYIGIRHIIAKTSVFDIPEFSANVPDRCYFCKKALFSLMLSKVQASNIYILLDGSNVDDTRDFRPGMKALEELGIKSPLLELGFTKKDIREFSRRLALPTWNKQSFACLASRFPYGTPIYPELLEKTWKAEALLKDLGFRSFRVRNHGNLARIELDMEGLTRIMEPSVRDTVVQRLKSLGFIYITVDLQGYRTGSMNEPLKKSAQV